MGVGILFAIALNAGSTSKFVGLHVLKICIKFSKAVTRECRDLESLDFVTQ